MDTSRIGIKESVFVLTRAANKFLSLTAGDVIRARVVDVRPGGDVSLRVKGNLVQAKSTLRLTPGSSLLLRVLGRERGEGGSIIRLQLLEVATGQDAAEPFQGVTADDVRELVRDLAAILPTAGREPNDLTSTIEQLLKTLPDNAATLPREVREQLLGLLRTSLGGAAENLQNRLNVLLSEPFLKGFAEQIASGNFMEQLLTDMELVLQTPLQSTLENSGVALEAKLRALVQTLPPADESVPNDPMSASAGRAPESDQLQGDLKARLLQIRQMILDVAKQVTKDAMPVAARAVEPEPAVKAALERSLAAVDGLLRDIETFQLLSKLTGSFYTFLPVIWKGLREAQVAFKRSRGGPPGRSYYCLMNLDFETFGKVTIVAMVQERDFFVSFKADHAGFRSLLEKNVQELQRMFQRQGLNLKAVNFLDTGDDHLLPFERLESFENIINIKI